MYKKVKVIKMEKIKFIYHGQKKISDFEEIKDCIEAIANFPYYYPDEIISISLSEYKLIIMSPNERYSYENCSGVWGNRIVFEI